VHNKSLVLIGLTPRAQTDRWLGKMRNILLCILGSVLVSGCHGKKPIAASRLIQPAGQFSYITPDGWYRSKVVGIPFIIASTDTDFGAAPNIYVDSVNQSSNLSEVLEDYLKQKKENLSEYQVAGRDRFKTDSGLAGTKVRADRKNKDGLPLALFHYVIENSGQVIAITCTCSEPVKEKYEPVFDNAMKSLRSEKESQQDPGEVVETTHAPQD